MSNSGTPLVYTNAEFDTFSSVPTKPDGQPWRYVLAGAEQTLLADHCSDIIDAFIPGYAEIPDTVEGSGEALIKRYEFALAAAGQLQIMRCVTATEEGHFNPEDETEETLTVLFEERVVPATIDSWDHATVPLVLIATDYAPFVPERTPPAGNILWIDPSDELSFLNSLSSSQFISFYRQSEVPAETDRDSVPIES